MNRRILFALMLCLNLSASAFLAEVSTSAQTKRQTRGRSAKKQKPTQQAALADPYAEQRKEVNDGIVKVCKKLEEAITKANDSFSQRPFDLLTPDPTFDAKCKSDGTLEWKAVRNGTVDDSADAQYEINVYFKVTDLNLGDLTSNHGVVSFRADKEKIGVRGPTRIGGVDRNADRALAEWWIDLREEGDRTKDFKESIRTLVGLLTTRAKLPPPPTA